MKKTVLFLVAAATLLLGAGPAAASQGRAAAGYSSSAIINFTIHIPRMLRLRTLQAASMVEVAFDRTNAPVEVRDAATLEVQSNMRTPAELRFDITDPEVESVEISGLDRPVRVTREGASVKVWPAANVDRTRRMALTYTIRYAGGARGGSRPMPVAYSLSAGA